jgi:NAD(P)-dependent dehydrogenase (short-subunit alcohol dehydrogenase family)
MAGVSLVLENKVALITGGSRGIGAETVRLFAQAGARVAFSYEKARDRAEVLAAECGGPERCMAIQQELSTPADGRALVAAAVRAFGRLDVLVANHGIWEAADAPIAEMKEAQWRRTLGVNLDSVFGLVQAAAGAMEHQGRSADGLAGAYCADQFHGRAAWRGLPRGLCRDERSAHQSDQEPVERVSSEGNSRKLRGSRLGGDGDVGGGPGRCGTRPTHRGGDSGGAARSCAGNCRADIVLVYAVRRLHLR